MFASPFSFEQIQSEMEHWYLEEYFEEFFADEFSDVDEKSDGSWRDTVANSYFAR